MAARRMLCLLKTLRAEAALYVLDPTDWAADLGEDLDWATANAPFVRLPGYPAIERVFYYRWRVVKKHIVPIDGGGTSSAFMHPPPDPRCQLSRLFCTEQVPVDGEEGRRVAKGV